MDDTLIERTKNEITKHPEDVPLALTFQFEQITEPGINIDLIERYAQYTSVLRGSVCAAGEEGHALEMHDYGLLAPEKAVVIGKPSALISLCGFVIPRETTNITIAPYNPQTKGYDLGNNWRTTNEVRAIKNDAMPG